MEIFSIEMSTELISQVRVKRDYTPVLTKKEIKKQKKIDKLKKQLEKLEKK